MITNEAGLGSQSADQLLEEARRASSITWDTWQFSHQKVKRSTPGSP